MAIRAPKRTEIPDRPASGGANDSGFLIELFSAFAPVAVRRMFSGVGVFTDGLIWRWMA